jgi:uncharacterized protein (TIGR02246 family)
MARLQIFDRARIEAMPSSAVKVRSYLPARGPEMKSRGASAMSGRIKMWKLAVLVLCCAVVATPASAQLKSQIQKVDDQFSEAFNKGDGAAVADHYTDDAVVLPPGSEMVKGKKDIVAFWKKTVDQLTELKAKTVDVKRLGHLFVREIGTFSFKSKADPSQEISGKYVVVWQKVRGKWKLTTDIWNTNK